LGPSISLWSEKFRIEESEFSFCFIMRGLGFVCDSYLSERLSGIFHQGFLIILGNILIAFSQGLIYFYPSLTLIISVYLLTGLGCGLLDV
jgi:Na+/melibiose symporter-like transporter